MRLQELFYKDLGDDGATIRLREILGKVLEQESLDQTTEITKDIRKKLLREAYLLPPFDTKHCFEEYNERVLRQSNFENPIVILLRFLRSNASA